MTGKDWGRETGFVVSLWYVYSYHVYMESTQGVLLLPPTVIPEEFFQVAYAPAFYFLFIILRHSKPQEVGWVELWLISQEFPCDNLSSF